MLNGTTTRDVRPVSPVPETEVPETDLLMLNLYVLHKIFPLVNYFLIVLFKIFYSTQ